jgi:hypothetical protein
MSEIHNLKSLFVGASLAVLSASCSTGVVAPPDVMQDVGVPPEALNTDIRVWAPEGLSLFKINEPLGLAVEVTGTEDVIFPRDYGNRMFVFSDGEWAEVENVPTDWGEGAFLVSPSHGDPKEWASTRVFPWFEEIDDPIILRVFVVGNRYRQGVSTDEKVGAFVDVELSP